MPNKTYPKLNNFSDWSWFISVPFIFLRSAGAFLSLRTCSVPQSHVAGSSSVLMSKSANQIESSDNGPHSVTAASWNGISNFLVPLSRKNLQKTQDEIIGSKLTEQDLWNRALRAFSFPHLLPPYIWYPYLRHFSQSQHYSHWDLNNCLGDCSVHFKMVHSIPDQHPPNASSEYSLSLSVSLSLCWSVSPAPAPPHTHNYQ